MYGKIFSSIYDGTLYGQWEAIVTFQQMIVLADAVGEVDMTPPALSARTSIPLEIIEKGLRILSEPDPYSRSNNHDGRRIELLNQERPWGWRIINYTYYRTLASKEEKRERDRLRIAEKRAGSITSRDVAPCRHVSQGVANVAQGEGEGEEEGSKHNPPTEGGDGKPPPCPFDALIKLFHETLPALPRCKVMTETRRAHMRARWREYPSLEEWREFFRRVSVSPFLMGKVSSKDRRPFKCTLDWLVKPENFAKVLEGKYAE